MTQGRRLGLVLSINLLMVSGLLVVGLVAHSLGVLASAADYLGDALGAGLSLMALRISRKQSHTRATSYAALANASFLLVVTSVVAVDAAHRLHSGSPHVDGLPVVVVSVLAAIAMVACAFILGHVEGDLSMQSVMLDTIADAAAALGVAASGAVILITGKYFLLDSLIALSVAVVVGYHAIKLIRRVIADLRER